LQQGLIKALKLSRGSVDRQFSFKTQKIDELKELLNKYPRYQNNDPDEIMRLVVYYCINGDNTLLDDKLEQLRIFDSLAKY